MTSRIYATKRSSIVNALAEKLKTIDGTGHFLTNVYDNVSPRLLFWDEVSDFPAIHLNAGQETREYQGGGYRDRFLNITLRCYVNEENAQDALSALMEDVETVLEDSSRLKYLDKQGVEHFTHQISLMSLETDEGVLEPLGVGELQIEVRY